MSDELRGLPTRTGTPTGHANERQMLEKIRDNLGFETSARVRPDGSYTLLRTKGGMPRFITDPVPPAVASIIARGFLARATAKPFGAIFDPYDLDIEVKQYKPASITYYVGKAQAAAYEPRKWRDVWSWDGSLLRINGVQAKTFYPLKFPADVKGAIPYIIPWPSAPIYGTKETNSPLPKRVFAVGPESVGIAISPAYGAASIAAVKLAPETPRSNRKALVCGAAIDPTAHEATLSQLYFTGALWDSLAGGWAYSTTRVAMLLTVPFLQETNASAGVDMPVASLSNAGSTVFDGVFDVSLPAAEVSLIGIGELGTTMPYVHSSNYGFYRVKFPWRDVLMMSVPGEKYGSVSRQTYSGSDNTEQEMAGVSVAHSASNVKVWDSRSERLRVKGPIYLPLPATHDSTTLHTSLSATATEILAIDIASIPPTRGRTNVWIGRQSIPGSFVVRGYEEQLCEITVSIVDADLVRLTFSRNKSSGNEATPIHATGYYAADLANPYGSIGSVSGMGVYSSYYTDAYVSPATDTCPINDVYKQISPPGTQAPEATTEINAKYTEISNAFAAQTLYDNENSNGYPIHTLYSGATIADKSLDDRTLNWETRDYILFDDLNSTFIFVEGHFSATQSGASPASATLTVLLTIETPHGTASTILYSTTYTYSNMLPEVELVPGKYAIPSPQIRAIFAPAFREQGAFRGAAYVTADEESNGAAPAIVVNFVLALETYAFIGEDEPTDKMVHFVPCNLLEMLYAFVYSRGYGIDPTARYPVTDTAAYNAIMAGLFGVQHPIHYRDGAFSDWVAGLGNPYYADKKTELSRV